MGDFFASLGQWITAVSDFVCGYPLFILLVGGGLYFLLYSGFVPLRYYGKAIKALKSDDNSKAEGQISSFEALASAIAATVGMGNIAGVAAAIQCHDVLTPKAVKAMRQDQLLDRLLGFLGGFHIFISLIFPLRSRKACTFL